MKQLLLLLFLFIGSLHSHAQSWNKLQQKALGLQYQLPQGWYVGGYKQGKTCNCSGATINSSTDNNLSMVIFRGSDQGIQQLKALPVWGYNFVAGSQQPNAISTEYLSFEQEASTWKEASDLMVLRFSTQTQQGAYVIYFWGSLDKVTTSKSVIEQILNSMEVL